MPLLAALHRVALVHGNVKAIVEILALIQGFYVPIGTVTSHAFADRTLIGGVRIDKFAVPEEAWDW